MANGERPGSLIDARELWVLNPKHNPVPESVLAELGTPSGRAATRTGCERRRAGASSSMCFMPPLASGGGRRQRRSR
jgi:hypothetical protein